MGILCRCEEFFGNLKHFQIRVVGKGCPYKGFLAFVFYGRHDCGFDGFFGVVVGEVNCGGFLLVEEEFGEFIDLFELAVCFSEGMGLEELGYGVGMCFVAEPLG